MAKKQKLEFQVSANTRRFAQGMKKVKNSARETGRTMGTMFGGKTGMLLGGGGLIVGMGMLAKESVSLAGDLEQTKVAFEVLTGSAKKAESIISDLMQFSNVTPFEPEQVVKAGKTLTALGVESKELMADLQSIGDIASGTGKDFNELAVIFGKARTAGRLDGRDLNQLLEAGVPIIKQLSKQFKIGEGQVRKYISSGKVGFTDLRMAFREMSGDGGRFFNMMQKQSETFNGQMSTLTGNIKNVGIAIGNELLPVLNSYLKDINAIIQATNQLKTFEKGGSDVEQSFLQTQTGASLTNLLTGGLIGTGITKAITGKTQAELLDEMMGGEKISVGASDEFNALEQKRKLQRQTGVGSALSIDNVMAGRIKAGQQVISEPTESTTDKKLTSIGNSFSMLITQLQEERSGLI